MDFSLFSSSFSEDFFKDFFSFSLCLNKNPSDWVVVCVIKLFTRGCLILISAYLQALVCPYIRSKKLACTSLASGLESWFPLKNLTSLTGIHQSMSLTLIATNRKRITEEGV